MFSSMSRFSVGARRSDGSASSPTGAERNPDSIGVHRMGDLQDDTLKECADAVDALVAELELSPEAAATVLPVFMRAEDSFGLGSGQELSRKEIEAWHARCEQWIKDYRAKLEVGVDEKAERIALERCDGGSQLILFARDCPRLRDVSLRNGYLNDKALSSVAIAMKGRLRTLDLHGTRGFTDRGLKAVAAHADKLEELRIGGGNLEGKVTDESLTKIARYCRHLRLLELEEGNEPGGDAGASVTRAATDLLDSRCVVERVGTDEPQRLSQSRKNTRFSAGQAGARDHSRRMSRRMSEAVRNMLGGLQEQLAAAAAEAEGDAGRKPGRRGSTMMNSIVSAVTKRLIWGDQSLAPSPAPDNAEGGAEGGSSFSFGRGKKRGLKRNGTVGFVAPILRASTRRRSSVMGGNMARLSGVTSRQRSRSVRAPPSRDVKL